MLVKSVSLPNFKFDVKKVNNYNRKAINVTRINYDPVNIEFHDDMASTMRGFWYAYYQYYNQDPRYNHGKKATTAEEFSNYKLDQSNVYTPIDKDLQWGLDTKADTGNDFNRPEPFFKAINIYHFSRNHDNQGAHYQEYVLVNPVISSFQHDTLSYSEGQAAKCSMTIEHETVLYNSGIVGKDQLASWAAVQSQYWDGKKSPLHSNPTASIFGTGGLLETGGSVLQGLTSGNPLQMIGAVITGARAVNTVKQAGGLGAIAKNEVTGIITNNLIGLANGNKSISVPGIQNIPGIGGTLSGAVESTNGFLQKVLSPAAKTKPGG